MAVFIDCFRAEPLACRGQITRLAVCRSTVLGRTVESRSDDPDDAPKGPANGKGPLFPRSQHHARQAQSASSLPVSTVH